jgi:hypothetical protein
MKTEIKEDVIGTTPAEQGENALKNEEYQREKLEEKIDIIMVATQDALEKIAEAREILEGCERETGYSFEFGITQELGESCVGSLANLLASLNEDEVKEELL